MLFEEFFKKKKISLDALKTAEPALYVEFKTHFEAMGEKSFDHTKKYWFNKLRLQYPAPAEQKTEKVKIDNPLAEQTITDSLEQAAITPKPGITPRFRAAATPKPAEGKPVEEKKEETPAAPASAAPKPGLTPRFKAANMAKPAEKPVEENPSENTPSSNETPASTDAPKPAYKPRFNPQNLPKKEE